MFKDTEKELKRLEEELLAETQKIPTDTDELLEQLHQELDPVPVTNSDALEEDAEEFGKQVAAEPPKERLTGLVVTALLLTAGILGLVAWWLVRLMG